MKKNKFFLLSLLLIFLGLQSSLAKDFDILELKEMYIIGKTITLPMKDSPTLATAFIQDFINTKAFLKIPDKLSSSELIIGAVIDAPKYEQKVFVGSVVKSTATSPKGYEKIKLNNAKYITSVLPKANYSKLNDFYSTSVKAFTSAMSYLIENQMPVIRHYFLLARVERYINKPGTVNFFAGFY